jgi:erythromycin esterase-like protein
MLLVSRAAEARYVLLGESTHGTEQFYRDRAQLSERLIMDHGFDAVLIEAEPHETARVNRYIRGLGADRSADEALSDFEAFPRWMWRNTAFRDFVERLREVNQAREPESRIGLYGIDAQDLPRAVQAVLRQSETLDPDMTQWVRDRYRCFQPHLGDEAAYGIATRRSRGTCQEEAAAVLDFAVRRSDALPADEEAFALLLNAASVASAEAYVRAAFAGSYSWNVRDRAMASTVERVAARLDRLGSCDRGLIVWAHNSHVGDARATDAAQRGEINLGQVLRERFGNRVLLVGLFTNLGQVTAAQDWGESGVARELNPASAGSLEAFLDSIGDGRQVIPQTSLVPGLEAEFLQRAIGVVYRPREERTAHYLTARPAEQFDALIFHPRSLSVRPIN